MTVGCESHVPIVSPFIGQNSQLPPDPNAPGDGGLDNGNALTFTQFQTQILNVNCVGCHNGTNNAIPDFRTYNGVIAQVVSGQPGASNLYNEVATGAMPKGGNPLTADQIAGIGDWIAGGAPNN